MWPELASSRLIGLSIIIAGVAILHASVTRLHTERGPVLLLALMLLVSRVGSGGPASDLVAGRLRPFAVGLIAGSMAFAELPGRLLAVLLCLIFLHANGWKRRLSFPTVAAHAAWLAP